jgi:hypothetical protein
MKSKAGHREVSKKLEQNFGEKLIFENLLLKRAENKNWKATIKTCDECRNNIHA